MAEALHWAFRTPAQNAAWQAGWQDEEDNEPTSVLPRYADPLEQACYLEGREAAAEAFLEWEWETHDY